MYEKIYKLAKSYEKRAQELSPLNLTPDFQTLARKMNHVLGTQSPVVLWFENHRAGQPTSGLNPAAFKADFQKLSGRLSEAELAFLKGEMKKAFGNNASMLM